MYNLKPNLSPAEPAAENCLCLPFSLRDSQSTHNHDLRVQSLALHVQMPAHLLPGQRLISLLIFLMSLLFLALLLSRKKLPGGQSSTALGRRLRLVVPHDMQVRQPHRFQVKLLRSEHLTAKHAQLMGHVLGGRRT